MITNRLTDKYNRYINQSQFYRQIRNIIFDLTIMNKTNTDLGNEYVPTGVHWQVGQATSLQNLHFEMPVSDSTATTAVGIFMENGSGGFMSDITFFGGNIGFRAGTQQYTARNLEFTSCLTAISSIWNWGFTWKNIKVTSCYIAIDCTNVGGIGDQGTGSITVLGRLLTSLIWILVSNYERFSLQRRSIRDYTQVWWSLPKYCFGQPSR
jgi:glucan 1,3-beta-glucosidase